MQKEGHSRQRKKQEQNLTNRRAQNALPFGKRYSSGIEGQHVQKVGELEKKNWKRVWAINYMGHINLRTLIRVGLDGCA